MPSERVVRIYEQHIRSLSVQERLELLALVTADLAAHRESRRGQRRRSVLELRGLGKEIWEGLDAQMYVNRLRDEWEKPA